METMTHGEKFDHDGYISGIDILSDSEVAKIRTSFDEIEARLGKDEAQIGIIGKEREVSWLWNLATHPGILDAVQRAYGEDLLLIGTHVFCKYPVEDTGTEAFVAWHQDVTYWGLEPPKAITAWLAIDDADEENGAMMVIPGSHLSGILDHGTSREKGNLLSVNQAVSDEAFDPDSAVTLTLRAGQISLHDGLTIHGSLPNHSTRRRCGAAIRYTTPEVRIVGNENQTFDWQAVLVRGEDRHGNLQLLPEPEFATT